MTATTHLPDESQRRVIEAGRGHHLVLAPPGCGKTHVLTERIDHARRQGVAFSDMLCLTFTNRAAREMLNRIGQRFEGDNAGELSVGSIHRYCSRFLIGGERVEADTSIIDDEDAVSIIADYMHEDAENVVGDYRRYQKYQEVIFFSHLMHQVEHGHSDALFMHPEVWTEEDRVALRRICQLQHFTYGAEAMLEVYRHADNYRTDAWAPLVSSDMGRAITHLTLKMYYAYSYEQYKRAHHLLDFEDLLLLTYDILRTDPSCKRYPWIQVDEVQDLNAMQLAIIDQLTAPDASVVYLGDEQQAIFSFMGAKLETLESLRLRCRGHIYHLSHNHRSPAYLLSVLNRYAEHELHIHPDLLPTTDNHEQAPDDALRIVYSANDETEVHDVADLAASLNQTTDDTTAIIVSTNREADSLSEALAARQVPHFKVSGRDIFSTKEMKMLLAHLSVLCNEHGLMAWTRLLRGFKVFPNDNLARRFVIGLRQKGLSPTDLLLYTGGDSYTQQFVSCYEAGEMVVFDTETTGLNVLTDDIIELSAMRIRGGRVVGEPLDLYVRTSLPTPRKLGDKDNPLYHIYKEKEAAGLLLQPAEAFQRFFDFVGTRPLVGHNVNYDLNILDHNLRRHTGTSMASHTNVCFDTLKLVRLLMPGLKSYKLESLLATLQLEGTNSHQAIDDVDATVHLVAKCHELAQPLLSAQRTFLLHPKVAVFAQKLSDAYGEYYRQARQRLYCPGTDGQEALPGHLAWIYGELRKGDYIADIPKLDYVLRYVDTALLTADGSDAVRGLTLADQLGHCLMTLCTMKEADFCNTRAVEERIYVTTIHKAKGLEFGNVIVFDTMAGRFPSARNKSPRQDEEDKRRLYVAMSRARRRLFLTCGLEHLGRYGRLTKREVSPFLTCILSFFN